MKSDLAVFLIIEGIPEHETEIPLIEDDNNPLGKWKLPGGKGGPGETWQQAGPREIAEELGIVVEISSPEIYEDERLTHKFVVARARYVSGELQLGPKVKRRWFGTESQIRGTRERGGLIFFSHSKGLEFFGI